jgi:hypothetical protein
MLLAKIHQRGGKTIRLLTQVAILLFSTQAFAETSKPGQYFCYVTKTAGIRGAAIGGGVAGEISLPENMKKFVITIEEIQRTPLDIEDCKKSTSEFLDALSRGERYQDFDKDKLYQRRLIGGRCFAKDRLLLTKYRRAAETAALYRCVRVGVQIKLHSVDTGLLTNGASKDSRRFRANSCSCPAFPLKIVCVRSVTPVGVREWLVAIPRQPEKPFARIAGKGAMAMELEKLRKCTDWFKVNEFKDIADPSGQVARKELVVPLDQYPYNFGLGPNPREPDPTSRVSKRIGETLKTDWQNFHLLNRGVVVVAKHIDYDNKSQRVRLTLDETPEDERLYGILDGGNTTERINLWRKELTDEEAEERLPHTFVNMQVLIPQLKGADVPTAEMQELLNDVKDARNTSVQVKTKSLADARQHFDILKSVLADAPYADQISWHEGQAGQIDALQILILLMIFYPSFSEAAENGEPNNAYGHKERCLDAFLEYSEKEPEKLQQWIAILPEMLGLYDELQLTFPNFYEGRFGKINEVQIYDAKRFEKGNKKYRKTPVRTQYFGREMKYSYPVGWLYPLYSAFRFLAASNPRSGKVSWRDDPIAFWNRHGEEICASYMPHIIAAGYEPKKIATNPLCYQAVRQKVSELFKDDLLRQAGISV